MKKQLFPASLSLAVVVWALAVTVNSGSAQSSVPANTQHEEWVALRACAQAVAQGIRHVAPTRDLRFQGKVSDARDLCRGGVRAESFRMTPWVDWGNYWGTGDMASLPTGFITSKGPAFRGVTGALLDLEFERVELIKFNLFDNNGTYKYYVLGRNSTDGPALKMWPSMRLPATNPNYAAVGGDGTQTCTGDLVRGRTLSGICNDVLNPLMGSTGTPFARNVEFETSFPELGANELTRNRHAGRLGLLTPDPQVISRTLFTRKQTPGNNCNAGFGANDNALTADRAKLLQVSLTGGSNESATTGYLPLLQPTDPHAPQWEGQESVAFPDNFTIGLSFLHNLFVREHNSFVTAFRKQAALTPDKDSGLRNPSAPTKIIRYRDVTPDELFAAARLVVAAEIAKIHTIEWTPQLLYNDPLYKGMNANWNGLLGAGEPLVSDALRTVVKTLGTSSNANVANQWYSVLASGPGIFGLGSTAHNYDITKPASINGGVNHFGSPFNFPEEFVSVYRLHPLVPDLIEFRDLTKDPNQITAKISVISTFEGKSATAMRTGGMANWGLSLGRQRLGLLTLHNHPQFMQNITLPRLDTPTKHIDLAALDIIRDREHGVPRFNEFRRQYGLRQLTSYDDFIDHHLDPASDDYKSQQEIVTELRQVYGTHVCDSAKIITDAQINDDKTPINDCLGHPNGSVVDNIEDVDTVVGYLAESTRPHGFAISETQFVVFILNASRRLYSDRFFTSSFRPEFYTQMGVDWVTHNGPGPVQLEKGSPNGHTQPVSPLKRVLLRNIPELKPELDPVINAFDPWARDRGQYYSLAWKPRPGAESDPAFNSSAQKASLF